VIEGGTVRIHTPGGGVREVVLETGRVGFQSAVESHSIENLGETKLRVLMIEHLRTDRAQPTIEDGMEQQCKEEVVQLHRFFEDWFRGRLDDTDPEFARFAGVLGESFSFVSTDGVLLDRTTLLDAVRGSYASWRGDPAARIWIENARLLHHHGELATMVYEEWQQVGERIRGRLSTVVFQLAADRPNGVVWLHVHEVWLPEDSAR
jgi:hypothetical protein